MKSKILTIFLMGLFFCALTQGQAQSTKSLQPQVKAPLPMYQLAEEMAKRLNNSLQVKTVVGEPMKVGKVTLIPIMMIDIGFGGGGGGAPQAPEMGGKGFYMSGEARPLGFVVVSKAGTKFVSVGKIPKK
ncbi:MAG: spore germination protein GerW family protein [Candidatus Aminicenantales bacterium]